MTQIANATVKLTEMDKDMESHAILCAQEGMVKKNNEQEVAAFIKYEFDAKYGPTWNCFVGRNFGSYVTHEQSNYIYFYIGQMGVLLFKS